MGKCKVHAFLLCERATKESDGKVTLHGIFDRIIVPQAPAHPKLFFAYYKVVVEEPCIITLRVIDPLNGEIGGNWRDSWRDSIAQVGPIQSIWALTTTLFKQPGPYALELRQETDGSEALSLATMLFVVEKESE